MRNIRKLAAASITVSLAGGIMLSAASGASAINEVTCTNSNFLTVYNAAGNGPNCFATAGTMSIYMPRVNAASGGNNAGKMTAPGTILYFYKQKYTNYGFQTDVREVTIY